MEWIKCSERQIEFDKIFCYLTEDGRMEQFRNNVPIFEHGQILYDLITATYWMEKPTMPTDSPDC